MFRRSRRRWSVSLASHINGGTVLFLYFKIAFLLSPRLIVSFLARVPMFSPATHPTRVESFSLPFNFLPTILSNPPKWNSILKYTTPTSMRTVVFVWTFWKTNGVLRWPSPKCCCRSVLCWRTPTQTTHWSQKLHVCTKPKENSMRKQRVNGHGTWMWWWDRWVRLRSVGGGGLNGVVCFVVMVSSICSLISFFWLSSFLTCVRPF